MGWDASFAEDWSRLADDASQPVRVLRIDRGGWLTVAGEARDLRGRQHPRFRRQMDSLELPTVGDWGALRPDTGGGPPLVESLLPRRTVLVRNIGGDEERARPQAVAANMDTVLIVLAANEPLNERRLDRFLSIATASGAGVAVALTKADACEDLDAEIHSLTRAAPGLPVHPMSAKTGMGIADLLPYLAPGRTCALLGVSGVGKSTLLNRLAGADLLATGEVRADGRGRHTTTHRELVRLPGGGLLIDTPGVRSVGLWEEAEEHVFDDVDELVASCRFADCAHETEPDCAIQQALATGDLSPERWDSYLTLHREVEQLVRKQGLAARAAETRRARAIHREIRDDEGEDR